MLSGGDNGPVFVSGKPSESLLLRAVRHEGPKMPPKEKLPLEAIAALSDWIKQGAPWPAAPFAAFRKPGVITDDDRRWWAFQPVVRPTVPEIRNPKRETRNAIDPFVLAKHEAKGLSPVEPADRLTLLRRVTYDLIGLPPTPEEITDVLNDKSLDWYDRAIERLLASPHYGERWGRHWLDVVRYADTAGDNSDYPVPQLYKYRNWVINAFNRDQPYDQFLREQLAGDLMPSKTELERRERIIATGYLANTRRFGSYEDTRYQWYLTYEDTIDNLGRAFLGLTINCTRCHDHKFDPILSEDYYALYGFFQSTRYPWPGIELDKAPRDLVPLAAPEVIAKANQERKGALAKLDERIKQLEKEKSPQLAAVRKERDALARTPMPFEVAYAVAEGSKKIGHAKMQLRGDPEKPGKEVPRRFPVILGGQVLPSDEKGSGRLQLAQWLSDAKNPLTARVLVNRLWQHHFGKGIVATPSDFGRQGKQPTHPELLDYLANRFVAGGWSIKEMHRLILTSRTYQLSSEEQAGNQERDPNNDYLWRANRRRLDAEAIRDTLLAVSGVLDRTPGAAHPFPDPKSYNFTQHNPFRAVYDTDRRSIYLMTQRIQRHPYLGLFDGPDTNASTAQRTASTTTLQALYLMNNPFVHEQAKRLAERLLREPRETTRLEGVFLLTWARPATEEEKQQALAHLREVRQSLGSAPDAERRAWESLARALLMSNEFVYLN